MNLRYIVAGVVQKDNSIILGKKAKGVPPYPDVWHTPGGGVEDVERAKDLFEKADFDNEYFHSELKRELREELGIEVKNIKCIVPEYRKVPREGDSYYADYGPTHFYFLEYICDYSSGTLQATDDLAEAIWVDKKDIKNYKLTPPSQEMYRELRWI